jgi:ubiquinone/menaquinone biosynthesis C-methylase UbiE
MKTEAKPFKYISDNIFKPIYPVLINQAINRTGISAGKALDCGCGPGGMGISITEITDMDVTFLDISPEMIAYAKESAFEKGINKSRVSFIVSDVHNIPVEDNYFDLVVSRGSIFFWQDCTRAFSEIARVLKPCGRAYLGGGFGSEALKEAVCKGFQEHAMKREMPCKSKKAGFITGKSKGIFSKHIIDSGAEIVKVIQDESGLWLIFKKGGKNAK